MNAEEQKRQTRHGKHVRVACEFCPDHKMVLRFRHVAHVRKCHADQFKAFWKASGRRYPKVKRDGEHAGEHVGEQMVNNRGEHVVNIGEHLVNIGEHMVNIKKFQIGEPGEQMVNMVHLKKTVNIGEQLGEHLAEQTVNIGEQHGEHWLNNGEHIGEQLYQQCKLNILKSLSKEELAQELYLRMMKGEVEGGGLEGVKIDGGKLQLLFIPNLKEQ